MYVTSECFSFPPVDTPFFIHTAIGIYKPEDVREIIKSYEGKDIPLEYAKQEALAKLEHIEEHKRKRLSAGSLTLSSLFGGSSSPVRDIPYNRPL